MNTTEPDFGPINPDILAAIRNACGPRQLVTPEDDPKVPNSVAWWRVKNRAFAAHNTPTRYATATTDRTEIHAWVLAVVSSPSQAGSLMLAGPTGTGKTYAAYAALRLASESYRITEWIAASTATLFGSLRPAAGRDTEAAMNSYTGTDLLFLDDLGAEKRSEWTDEVLYRIVDHRWNHCLPTIFATNFKPAELTDRLGDRTASRLAGMCRTIGITGEDRRKEMR